jgi:hypothetical protein
MAQHADLQIGTVPPHLLFDACLQALQEWPDLGDTRPLEKHDATAVPGRDQITILVPNVAEQDFLQGDWIERRARDLEYAEERVLGIGRSTLYFGGELGLRNGLCGRDERWKTRGRHRLPAFGNGLGSGRD